MAPTATTSCVFLGCFLLSLLMGEQFVLTQGFTTTTATTITTVTTTRSLTTALFSENDSQATSVNSEHQDAALGIANSRRNFLGALAAVVGGSSTGLTGLAPPSHATYSAYTRREQDWQERKTNDEVKYSSARDLRQQLQEIVPQNSDGSKIFCPNGPSAAVSPLMENKCGDRMAMPSVYGRSNDAMGNSIPGFSEQWLKDNGIGNIADGAGGFPSYQGASGRATLRK
mmetsp:Transcript_28618/g.78609  ORF Transcript_28618/g.78609 Transcript_28618/m.78609 type:complete len:228 (-) Transcript_28618:1650-2333(-)